MTYWAVFTAASVLAEVLQAWASSVCKIPVTACIFRGQPLPFLFTGMWVQGSLVAEKLTNFQHPLSARRLKMQSGPQWSGIYHFPCGVNFAYSERSFIGAKFLHLIYGVKITITWQKYCGLSWNPLISQVFFLYLPLKFVFRASLLFWFLLLLFTYCSALTTCMKNWFHKEGICKCLWLYRH